MGIGESDPCSKLSLPPGFRFYPTDEELVVQYLCRKVAGHHFSLEIIGDVDLYKFDAWDLPKKALFGEKEWYFFSPRDRKYPNGSRPNRMAGSGYWKATGTDKTITVDGIKVGIKKALVFYVGKAPKGTKTNWIMHEYRLCQSPRKKESTRFADCVLCRIYEKNSIGLKPEVSGSASPCSSQYDEVMETLPETGDGFSSSSSKMSTLKNSDGEEDQKMNLDWTTLAGLSPNWPEVSQAQNTGWRNDVYVPTPVGDVLSGSEFFPQDVRGFGFGVGQSYSGLVDPFEVPYPNLPGRLGFRQ